MAMRFDEADQQDAIVAEINITPLTDLFLVLLIIFMISSSAMIEGGLPVKLPSAKSAQQAAKQNGKPIYVTLPREGGLRVNEETIEENALESRLRDLLAQTQEKTVVIRGDESIVLGQAVKIMDAARSAGAERIALATQPVQPAPR